MINGLLHFSLQGQYHRVADVEGPRDRRSPKGQGLLRKEGPPTYAILSRNLELSRYTRFMNGHHRAFNESQLSQPAFEGLPTKVSLLSESFWRARFQRVFVEFSSSFRRAFGELTFGELSYNQYITKVHI